MFSYSILFLLILLLCYFLFIQDETRKKATSTYLLENSDIPPPRYQKDTGMPSFLIPNNAGEFEVFLLFLLGREFVLLPGGVYFGWE